MKTCKTCKQTKPLSEFYQRTAGSWHGYHTSCKECVRIRFRKRYATKDYRQKHRLYARGYRETHENKKYKRTDKAPDYIIKARGVGTRLPHPDKCEICNEQRKTNAHHPDYNDPSLVVFACSTCHADIHIQ